MKLQTYKMFVGEDTVYVERDDVLKLLGQEPTTKNDLAVDCIDRQATLDAIIKRLGIKNETYLLEAERAIYQQILAMPPATPIRPKGNWEIKDSMWWVCSACGCQTRMMKKYNVPNFCPACGADMRGEK